MKREVQKEGEDGGDASEQELINTSQRTITELLTVISEKEERLRKLNMVKTYRSKVCKRKFNFTQAFLFMEHVLDPFVCCYETCKSLCMY